MNNTAFKSNPLMGVAVIGLIVFIFIIFIVGYRTGWDEANKDACSSIIEQCNNHYEACRETKKEVNFYIPSDILYNFSSE